VTHKRVHRVYREAGLSIRRKKRKHCGRTGQALRACTAANQEWGLDFVHDAVECGRAIRVLSVVDAYTRECSATLENATRFPLSHNHDDGVLSIAEQVKGSNVVS
jgi:transposase InsO family protein